MRLRGRAVRRGGEGAGRACGRLGNHIRLAKISLSSANEMDSEAHTGSTEERSAVDGEEDGDPMLDCEWQGQYQRSLGEEGVFGRTILFRHADAGGQCEGYHWNNLHTMVSKDAKSAKM